MAQTQKHKNQLTEAAQQYERLQAENQRLIAQVAELEFKLALHLLDGRGNVAFISNSLADQLKLDSLREIWGEISAADIETLRKYPAA